MQSIQRAVNRGNSILLFNPESKDGKGQIEQYSRTKRGNFQRGAESLHLKQVLARDKKYNERKAEIVAEAEKKGIQTKARKLEKK
tara:strand:- start:128 stop:382 length:255 start_codon:yes stop_codon:yes gene_type:complete